MTERRSPVLHPRRPPRYPLRLRAEVTRARGAADAIEIPAPLIDLLVESMLAAEPGPGSWPAAKARMLEAMPQARFRHAASCLLDTWHSVGCQLPLASLALMIATASAAQQARAEEQNLELVWTGPDTGTIPVRQTEQAKVSRDEFAGIRELKVCAGGGGANGRKPSGFRLSLRDKVRALDLLGQYLGLFNGRNQSGGAGDLAEALHQGRLRVAGLLNDGTDAVPG